MVQSISTILCVTCQIAVKEWIFDTLPGICERDQPDRLTCPRNRVFYSASAIWCVLANPIVLCPVLTINLWYCGNRGLVGPTRQFGPTGVYKFFMYAMLIGALAPIPFWLWQRRFPDTRLKFINLPVLLNGPTLAPPANGINYASWFIVGLIFRTYLFIYSCDFCFHFVHVLFILDGRSERRRGSPTRLSSRKSRGLSLIGWWRDGPCLPCLACLGRP